MENIPIYISIVFVGTTFLSVWLLYRASGRSRAVIALVALLLLGQGSLALTQFFTITQAVPPRIVFLLLPPTVLIIALFSTRWGRAWLDRFDTRWLTILHVVRIPVELVLFWLALNRVVPTLMTFEGRNFDILTGLTAPLIYYFGFVKARLPKKVLLAWNLLCLGLLINIVVNGILSVPTTFQKFAFDQPNIALMYFPYVFLPGFIVPTVLLSHLTAIRQLLSPIKKTTFNPVLSEKIAN